LKPPSAAHWLGTDGFGRDVLSRVMWGSRVSLEIGFAATALALVVGTAMGKRGGLLRARRRHLRHAGGLTRSCRCPALFLIMIVVALFGASLLNTTLVIALVTCGTGGPRGAGRVPEPARARVRTRRARPRRRPSRISRATCW
jgi:ABC-type dipeptide/oligopeptide/nickel transport system permease subunit